MSLAKRLGKVVTSFCFVLIPLFFLPGCFKAGLPEFLYGSFLNDKSGCYAVLTFSRRMDLPLDFPIKFKPRPECKFSIVRGKSPEKINLLFSDPNPFPGGKDLYVSIGSGRWKPLVRGSGYPELLSVVWIDSNDNSFVDRGDKLQLHFNSKVILTNGIDKIPLEAFVLSGGSSMREPSLGNFGGKSEGKIKACSGAEKNIIVLDLGDDVYFRPSFPGDTKSTRFALNCSLAAPSAWIVAEDSGLGAVSKSYLPIVTGNRKKSFTLRGKIELGPLGGNLGASVTFCRNSKNRNGPIVVVAGGRNPDPKDLNPASDAFVFYAGKPNPMFWEGHLKRARSRHTALALPLPPESGLLGAVLFMGGYGPAMRPVRELEVLFIRNSKTDKIETGSRILPVPAIESGQRQLLLPRAGAEALYIPEGNDRGIVFTAGGEISTTGEGFVECLRIKWNDAKDDLEVVEYSGPLGKLSSRVDHKLTAVDMPDGRKGVLLFGGRLRSIGLSVAMPYLFYPVEAMRGSKNWYERLRIDENECMRQGLSTMYLPSQEKVVIIGGEVKLFSGLKWNHATEFGNYVIEFDLKKKLFAKLKGAVTDIRVDPELSMLPDKKGILVLGGRGLDDSLVSSIEVYLPGSASRKGYEKPGYFAFKSFLPEKLLEEKTTSLRCYIQDNVLYLVSGEGCSVWSLDL